MAIQKVFVIGAGQMGNGIAQVSAQAGYDVVMSDIKDEFIQKGMATIEKSLDRLVKRETIKETEKAAILSRIKTTVDNKEAKDADRSIPEIQMWLVSTGGFTQEVLAYVKDREDIYVSDYDGINGIFRAAPFFKWV